MRILAILFSGGTFPFPLFHRRLSPFEAAMAELRSSAEDMAGIIYATLAGPLLRTAETLAEFERQMEVVYGVQDS